MKRIAESVQSFVARHLLLVLIIMAFGNAGIAAGVYATYGAFIFTPHPPGSSIASSTTFPVILNDEEPINGLLFSVPNGTTSGFTFVSGGTTKAEISGAGALTTIGPILQNQNQGLAYINAQGTTLTTPHHEDGLLTIALSGTCAASTYNCGLSSGYTFTFKTAFSASPYCVTTNYGSGQLYPSISLVTTTYATVGEANPYSSTIAGAISNFVHCEGQ